MNKLFSLVALLVLSLSCFLGLAEDDNARLLNNPNGPAQYSLGPGDQISIHVQDLDEVSEKPVRIDPAGDIDLPLIGRLHVSGMSIEQLRTALVEQLSKYVNSPKVAINILDYHSQPVSVIGAVANPGIHQLQSPKRLLDVISMAGGLRQDAGAKLTVTRQINWGILPLPNAHTDTSGQFSIAEVSVESLTTSKSPVENIFVRPNDTISIPKAEIIYVLGQVKKAGGFPLNSRDSISLLKALALAEGLDRDASPKHARIMRASARDGANLNELPVDVQQILDGRAPDMQLRADDVLFIPDNVTRSATRRALEAALQIGTGVVIYRR